MTTTHLRRAAYGLGCLLLSLTLASCSLISDDKCGLHFTAEDSGFGTSFAAWQTGVDGGNRFYRRALKVENVCPDEHVTADFRFHFKRSADVEIPITIRGQIEYNPLFPSEEVILAENLHDVQEKIALKGEVEAGLKQAFGDSPADYFVIFKITFPTTGLANRDLAYVIDITEVWRMKTGYFEFSSK
ncbi:MAG: hypothetical protein ACE5G0_14195 [Rhodothermales bacterium]